MALSVQGPRESLARYEQWLLPQLQAGQKWIKPDDSESQVGRSLANAERFFRLASLSGVLLGALAMGIAVRHFAERQTNMVALLKTLGASRRSLWQLMGTLLLSLTLIGALLGLVAGTVMQWITLQLLGDLLPPDLPPPSWRPFALGVAVALFITLLLAFVPFLRLLKVPPLRVLRRELEAGIPLAGPAGRPVRAVCAGLGLYRRCAAGAGAGGGHGLADGAVGPAGSPDVAAGSESERASCLAAGAGPPVARAQ